MEDLKKASEKNHEKLNGKVVEVSFIVVHNYYVDGIQDRGFRIAGSDGYLSRLFENQTIGSVPISLKATPVTEDTQINFF